MKINSTRTARLFRGSIAGAAALACLLLLFHGCKKHDDKPPKEVALELVAEALVSPLGLVEAPDHTKRLFILDQVGKIRIVDAGGNLLATPFIDLSSKLATLNPNYDERGLLGFAFHPDYKSNGRFFVYYNLPPRPGGPQPGASCHIQEG
jgi:hypothetical protein